AVYGEPRQSDLPVVETSPLEPIYSYGIAKKCAEEYLAYFAKTRGLSYVALRYGNIFGPRQPIYGEVGVAAIFSDRIRRGLPLTVFGSGKQTRDFLYVADAVDATVKSLSYAGNGVFNVASGRGTTVDELVVAFESAVGKPLEIRREAARHAELTHFHCSNRLAMDSLAWTPKVSIGDGVKLTLAEMV
ncbi:MAG: NAD-dependent epimerase/dehydratase family protein, partial [Bdellovibrionota bacterium]